jgi:hypothetical protein
MRRGNALNSAIRASPRFKVREAQAESGAGGHEGRQDVVGVAVRVPAGPRDAALLSGDPRGGGPILSVTPRTAPGQLKPTSGRRSDR